MKTLLLTGYNDTFAPLGELTAPRMLHYASLCGYDFHCFRLNGTPLEATWQKVGETRRGLLTHERVLWLDADQVVTNFTIRHEQTKGFHASLDWGVDATAAHHFSAGAYLACRDAIAIFAELLDVQEVCIGRGEWEQEPLRRLYEHYHSLITIHERRRFNAVHPDVHPTVVSPWQPGDWCAHLTMVPLPERVRLFHKIVS